MDHFSKPLGGHFFLLFFLVLFGCNGGGSDTQTLTPTPALNTNTTTNSPLSLAATPICLPSGSPAISTMESSLQNQFQTFKNKYGLNVTLNFAAITNTGNGDGDGRAYAQTICNGTSCQITLDPSSLNPYTAPIDLTHELEHVWCTDNDCGLNFNAVNSGSLNTGYSDTTSAPFSAQEIATHYEDYSNYLTALQAAINAGDETTAFDLANLATTDMVNYNQMMMCTQASENALQVALNSDADDSQLAATGTSADGQVSITFQDYAYYTGTQSVQISIISPGTSDGVLAMQFPLPAGSSVGAGDYAGAIGLLKVDVANAGAMLGNLPSQIPDPSTVYNMMVSAGYAPAGSFNSNLTQDFYQIPTSGKGVGTMVKASQIASAQRPPGGATSIPACGNNSPCSMTVIFPDGTTDYFPLECYAGDGNPNDTPPGDGSNGSCNIGEILAPTAKQYGCLLTLPPNTTPAPVIYGGGAIPGVTGALTLSYNDLLAASKSAGPYKFTLPAVLVTGLESQAVAASPTFPSAGYSCGTNDGTSPGLGGSGQITFSSTGPSASEWHGTITSNFSCAAYVTDGGTNVQTNIPGAQVILKF